MNTCTTKFPLPLILFMVLLGMAESTAIPSDPGVALHLKAIAKKMGASTKMNISLSNLNAFDAHCKRGVITASPAEFPSLSESTNSFFNDSVYIFKAAGEALPDAFHNNFTGKSSLEIDTIVTYNNLMICQVNFGNFYGILEDTLTVVNRSNSLDLTFGYTKSGLSANRVCIDIFNNMTKSVSAATFGKEFIASRNYNGDIVATAVYMELISQIYDNGDLNVKLGDKRIVIKGSNYVAIKFMRRGSEVTALEPMSYRLRLKSLEISWIPWDSPLHIYGLLVSSFVWTKLEVHGRLLSDTWLESSLNGLQENEVRGEFNLSDPLVKRSICLIAAGVTSLSALIIYAATFFGELMHTFIWCRRRHKASRYAGRRPQHQSSSGNGLDATAEMHTVELAVVT